jgi:HD-GYP domain-containing protein (c-di-GMP phosphodiesterase class II)/CheY-like chemotaxis protein
MSILSWDEFVRRQKGEYELTINPSDLRIGDYVVRIDAGPSVVDFPEQGRQVDTFIQKQWFKSHCRRVIIDLERCLNRRVSDADAAVTVVGRLPRIQGRLDALRQSKITARSLVRAWPVYRELSINAQGLILSFNQHGRIDLAGTLEAIDALLDAMADHMAALMWLTRIKEKSRYAFQHGLNVAIVGAAFAQAAGWDRKICQAVALSGLLHDLGMTRISLKVLNKRDALSAAEMDHIRLHTRLGYELLVQNDGVPSAVAQTVLCHHERPDGKGYPEGLTKAGIPDMARLIGLLDAYDAMTSTRIHRSARSHQYALGEIWKERDRQFDAELAEGFCRFLGPAPPGHLMRLPDGRLAVTLHSTGQAGKPLVREIHHKGEGFSFGVEIDLASPDHELSSDGKIGTLLPDGFSDISLRDLTRKLPRVLVSAGKASEQDLEPVRQERRRRPRVDAPRGTHMLVVDDALTVRKTLHNMLSQSGYRVSLAEDGESGLEQAVSHLPELIFLDIVLPDISGFKTLRRMRKNALTANIPVIMISGNAGAIEKFFLQRVGADDFIHKPFGRLEVFGAIERLIRSGTLAQRVAS